MSHSPCNQNRKASRENVVICGPSDARWLGCLSGTSSRYKGRDFEFAVAGFRRLTGTCSCGMSREKREGDRKSHCWPPLKVPEHCFRETEGWKHFAKGGGKKKPLCSLGCGPAFFGASVGWNFQSPYQFWWCAPILTQLPFQARVTDVTRM